MKLAYHEYGVGQPLVILHGLFGQSDNWNTLAKRYAAEGIHVFAIDLRNHGSSPHADEFNYKVMAEDLHEFIREHGLYQPVLMGHSLGGKVVLFHELLHPGTASKLIIADMAARSYPRHHDAVLEALNRVDFDRIKSRSEVEAELKALIHDAGTRQFLLKNVYWKDEKSGRLAFRFNLASITKHYEEVNVAVPAFVSDTATLVVSGERSHYVNDEDIADFHRRFARLEVANIHGAAHWIHAEKPNEYFSVTLDFIGS